MRSAVHTQTVTAREYLRVSRDRSGRERSPAEQHTDNLAAAGTRGWTLGAPYKDIGSASRYATKARDGFAKLIADLTGARFNAGILILWESSRGSRKVSEWVTLIELCEQRGVRIHVTSDGRTYDPGEARDRRSLLEDSVDAEYESAKVSKRTKRAAAATAAAGRPSGRIPYGYSRRYDPLTGKLEAQVEEPAEAKVIRELFKRLNKGHSLRSIAADFEARGVRTRTGLVFSEQHLRSLALNDAYNGQRVHDPDRHTVKTRLSENAKFITATWPALVDRATFLAVKRRLTAPERVTTRPGRATHLLSMIVRCDVCSGPICARSPKDREGFEYGCRDKGCVRVSYDDLNTLAEKVMLGWLARPDHVPWMAAQADSGEAHAAREQIAVIRAELDDLADKVGRGQLSASLAARAEPAILARLKAAQEREAQLSTPDVLRGLISPGADVARRWKAAPMSARREVARILLSPAFLGGLRVMRSPTPGHRCPVQDRITWRRS